MFIIKFLRQNTHKKARGTAIRGPPTSEHVARLAGRGATERLLMQGQKPLDLLKLSSSCDEVQPEVVKMRGLAGVQLSKGKLNFALPRFFLPPSNSLCSFAGGPIYVRIPPTNTRKKARANARAFLWCNRRNSNPRPFGS